MRGETWIFVCFYGCVVCPLKPGLYKLNGRSGRRHAVGSSLPAYALHIRRTHYTSVKTHKNQISPLTDPQTEKIMFFVIPEMPSKTFVMLYKKLPDHVKLSERRYEGQTGSKRSFAF